MLQLSPWHRLPSQTPHADALRALVGRAASRSALNGLPLCLAGCADVAQPILVKHLDTPMLPEVLTHVRVLEDKVERVPLEV